MKIARSINLLCLSAVFTVGVVGFVQDAAAINFKKMPAAAVSRIKDWCINKLKPAKDAHWRLAREMGFPVDTRLLLMSELEKNVTSLEDYEPSSIEEFNAKQQLLIERSVANPETKMIEVIHTDDQLHGLVILPPRDERHTKFITIIGLTKQKDPDVRTILSEVVGHDNLVIKDIVIQTNHTSDERETSAVRFKAEVRLLKSEESRIFQEPTDFIRYFPGPYEMSALKEVADVLIEPYVAANPNYQSAMQAERLLTVIQRLESLNPDRDSSLAMDIAANTLMEMVRGNRGDVFKLNYGDMNRVRGHAMQALIRMLGEDKPRSLSPQPFMMFGSASLRIVASTKTEKELSIEKRRIEIINFFNEMIEIRDPISLSALSALQRMSSRQN